MFTGTCTKFPGKATAWKKKEREWKRSSKWSTRVSKRFLQWRSHSSYGSRSSLMCFQRTFRSFLGSNCIAFSTSHGYLLANSVQSTRRGISQPSLLLPPYECRVVRKELWPPSVKLSSRFPPIKRNKPFPG